MKQNESHVIYTMTGLMAAAFIAATAYTGFNPAEIIPQLGEGWKFFTEDFLPPQVSFSEAVMECIAVTISLAISSAFVAAVLAVVAAEDADAAVAALRGSGVEAYICGEAVRGEGGVELW